MIFRDSDLSELTWAQQAERGLEVDTRASQKRRNQPNAKDNAEEAEGGAVSEDGAELNQSEDSQHGFHQTHNNTTESKRACIVLSDSSDDECIVDCNSAASNAEVDESEDDFIVSASSSNNHAPVPAIFRLRRSLKEDFAVYVQFLASCSLDDEFCELAISRTYCSDKLRVVFLFFTLSLEGYFKNAVIKVEDHLLSRRDDMAKSSVWLESFKV